jgi:hypothetical protein
MLTLDVKRRSWYQILQNQKAGDAQLLKGHGNIASRDEITANIPAPGGTCSALQTQGCVVGDKTTRTDKCNINAATARGALPRAAARWPRRLRLHAECANLRRSPRTRTQPHLAAARQVMREPCWRPWKAGWRRGEQRERAAEEQNTTHAETAKSTKHRMSGDAQVQYLHISLSYLFVTILSKLCLGTRQNLKKKKMREDRHFPKLMGAITSRTTHTNASHSQTSCPLTSSLSIGVPVPRGTQWIDTHI